MSKESLSRVYLLSFSKGFLEFFTSSICLVFSHKLELFHCYIHPLGSLLVRVFVGDQEKRSSSVPTIVIGVGSCGLGKLAGSCGELFL